jgi:hypothetical protein
MGSVTAARTSSYFDKSITAKDERHSNETFDMVREVHFDAIRDEITVVHWVRRKDIDTDAICSD